MIQSVSDDSLLPSSFKKMETFKLHTDKCFLKKFESFIDKVHAFDETGAFDQNDKAFLMEMARSTLATRATRGIESWTTLQSFRQCLNEPETPEHLDRITTAAIAYYALFAGYEIHDDLPALDNDVERRGTPTIWQKHGQDKAILFANMLTNFAKHILREEPSIADNLRHRLSDELDYTDALILTGQTIKTEPEETPSVDETIKLHYLKAAAYAATAAAGGAILAGADDDDITTMREFGRVIGHCGQMANDADLHDIKHDLEGHYANIIVAAGRGNIQRGATESAPLFEQYARQAQEILDSFDTPNPNLQAFIENVTIRFRMKSSLLARGINLDGGQVAQRG